MSKVVITTMEVKDAMRRLGRRTMTGRAKRKLAKQLKEIKMSSQQSN